MPSDPASGDGPDKGAGHPAIPSNATSGAPSSAPGVAPEWDSRDLLAGGREAIIRHGAQAYRLQLTGSNKLILTK